MSANTPAEGPKTYTYAVHPLDVWGNARDGYQVNDVYPSAGTVEISENATDREIVLALKRGNYIKRNIRHASVGIDGEIGSFLHVEYAPTAHPEYELRPVDPKA